MSSCTQYRAQQQKQNTAQHCVLCINSNIFLQANYTCYHTLTEKETPLAGAPSPPYYTPVQPVNPETCATLQCTANTPLLDEAALHPHAAHMHTPAAAVLVCCCWSSRQHTIQTHTSRSTLTTAATTTLVQRRCSRPSALSYCIMLCAYA